jgi:hypothetical protein
MVVRFAVKGSRAVVDSVKTLVKVNCRGWGESNNDSDDE